MAKTYQFIIKGEQRTSGEKLDIRNPYNNDIVGTVNRPTSVDVEDAIGASVNAFKETRKMKSWQRSELLRTAAQKLANRQEELAKILCLESGKPIRHARGD